MSYMDYVEMMGTYKTFHLNKTNVKIHFACVPHIMWAIMVILSLKGWTIGSYEIDLETVSPQKWIKYFETPKLDKTRRKRYLRDKARSMYPDLKKVSLKTADAILIATYAKENDNNS